MPAVDWNSALKYATLTDVGMRRNNNQDNHCVFIAHDRREWEERGHLFLVADGMGAHAAGELASKMAADGVPHTFLKRRDMSPAEALRTAIAEMNTQIHDKGENQFEFKGMGTTCSALLLAPQGALVGHVGDSRVYRLRRGRLEQLSFDHSLVWELRSAGDLADAETIHLPKNIITRSLGPNAKVEVDLEGPYPIEQGDTFLLCSDGLTGEVNDDELGVILDCLPPEEAARALVDLANLRGGPDNITVVIARVEGAALAGSTSTQTAVPAYHRKGGFLRTVLWLVAALAAAAALGAAAARDFSVAGAAAGAAVVCALLAVLFKPRRVVEPRPATAPSRYGTGPHTARDVRASPTIVGELVKTAEQLREAAHDPQYQVDAAAFEALCKQGEQAAASKDFSGAVASYCRAISFMMNELRRQRRRADDSNSNASHA